MIAIKKVVLFLLVLNVSVVMALDIKTGDVVDSNSFHSRMYSVGSLQQSILEESEFLLKAGPCWKMLNNSNGANIDITGSTLAGLLGKNTLANIRGTFLANAGGGSSSLGSIQEGKVKVHRHWISNAPWDDGNFTGMMTNGQMFGLWADAGVYSANDHGSSAGRYSGWHNQGGEVRPKNLGINTFIKINDIYE